VPSSNSYGPDEPSNTHPAATWAIVQSEAPYLDPSTNYWRRRLQNSLICIFCRSLQNYEAWAKGSFEELSLHYCSSCKVLKINDFLIVKWSKSIKQVGRNLDEFWKLCLNSLLLGAHHLWVYLHSLMKNWWVYGRTWYMIFKNFCSTWVDRF
jgi:hypothetical protein